VLVVATPIAVGLALVLWAATGPSDPVLGPVTPRSVSPSLPVLSLPGDSNAVISEVPPSEVAEAPLSEVTIRFELSPEDAVVSEGGGVIATSELRVPHDGRSHTFLIQARGRIPQRVSVTADEDRVVRVELARRGSGTNADRESSGGANSIAREF